MKKTPLVCVVLLVAGLGFADPLEMTHREIHIDSQNPSRTDTYINHSGDNMQLTDPIVGTAALNNWREKTTSTLVVDKNGRGDYTTIQGAIDAINDSAPTNPYVVYVMPGVYEEQVTLDEDYVAVIGLTGGSKINTANDAVIIKMDLNDDAPDNEGAVFQVKADEIALKNLTIINTHATVANKTMAINFTCEGGVKKGYVENCTLISNGRDTVFVYQGVTNISDFQFWNCYIEGGSDVCSIENGARFFNCWFYVNRTSEEAIYLNNNTAGSALWIVNCVFDGFGTNHIANFNSNDDVLYFYGNYISPNITAFANTDYFEYRGTSPTIYYSRLPGDLNLYGTLKANVRATTGKDAIQILKDDVQVAEITKDGDFRTTASVFSQTGLNVGTATGAAAGEIKTSGNISASGQRITAKLFDVEHYTDGLPTASGTYRGCLAFVEAGTGSKDKLYVCVKNADGSYGWDEIGHGISE